MSNGHDSSEDGRGRHAFVVTATLNSGGNNGDFRTEPGEHLVTAFIERTRGNGRSLEHQEDIAYALTNPGEGGRTQSRQIAGAFGVRRLTPVECERLQGFPDGFTAGQSDSTRYRQMGNAVAVPVVEWLGRRIVEAV
jgi:DNA (cytosine-5)-methyltransferase 1